MYQVFAILMAMRKYRDLIQIGLFLLIAFLIRILFIDWVPARLTVDEMSIGYNAYSILKTGRDEWGLKFPLVFQAFGDYKLPLYVYLSVPFVWLFGLSVFSVKLLSALCGVGFIWLIYRITKTLTHTEWSGRAVALVAVFSPWTLHLSRQALESHLALFLFTAGFYFFLQIPKNKKPAAALLAGIFFGLTFYAYVAYRLFILLILPATIWWLGWKFSRSLKIYLTAFTLVILPILPTFFSTSGLARARQTSLFTDPGIVSAVDENRSFCYLVDERFSPLCKIFFNKATQIGVRFVSNYTSFFSPEFLFISGDKNLYLNHPEFGEFLWLLLPALLLGFKALSRLRLKTKTLLFLILVLAPVPAAFSGSAQMVRASALVLPLTLLTGMGLAELWQLLTPLKYQFFYKGSVIISLVFLTCQFLLSYFVIYPTKYDNAAYQLPGQVSAFIQEEDKGYDSVYFHHRFTDAHIFLAFNLKLDPEWYQLNAKRPESDGFGFSHPTRLGTYYFGITSFEELYCKDQADNFLYITPEALPVTLLDGKKTTYSTVDYFNFSGVHPQAYLIASSLFEEFLTENDMTRADFCR